MAGIVIERARVGWVLRDIAGDRGRVECLDGNGEVQLVKVEEAAGVSDWGEEEMG